MAQRTTISDVAKLAGVGKVTVSYVLNGRGRERGISAETSSRIQSAAKTLNYYPHAMGQMLARRRTDTLGIVFQSSHFFGSMSPFISEVLEGVCQESVAQGFEVLLHTRFAEDVESEANYLGNGRLDGALLLRDWGDPLPQALKQRNLPIVAFFSRPQDPEVPYVHSDNFSGGRLAALHLLNHGHRRISHLCGPAKSVDASDRRAGFEQTLKSSDLEIPDDMVLDIYSPLGDMSSFVQMMKRPDHPTAIFAWSDDVAIECMRILLEMGFSVPQDVSIIGYDSTQACNRVTPALTSVRQPIAQMAKSATQLLVSLMRGEPAEKNQLVFAPQLDIRASTAPICHPSHSKVRSFI